MEIAWRFKETRGKGNGGATEESMYSRVASRIAFTRELNFK